MLTYELQSPGQNRLHSKVTAKFFVECGCDLQVDALLFANRSIPLENLALAFEA